MQNTTSCTLSVQNAAYCTSIAAKRTQGAGVGKDCEAGDSTRVSAIIEGTGVRFKGRYAGSTSAITGWNG